MARRYLTHSLPLLGLLIGGVAIMAVAGHHTTLVAVGLATVVIAGVLLVSLLFYEAGRSEDRERAADVRRHTWKT